MFNKQVCNLIVLKVTQITKEFVNDGNNNSVNKAYYCPCADSVTITATFRS